MCVRDSLIIIIIMNTYIETWDSPGHLMTILHIFLCRGGKIINPWGRGRDKEELVSETGYYNRLQPVLSH